MSATSKTSSPQTLDARPCRAVVFDFDGTLARLNIDFVVMRSDVLKLTAQYGLAVEAVCDLPALELIDRARATLAAVDPPRAEAYVAAAHARIMEIELAAARVGELFGGTRKLLVALQKRGIGTAIITRNCLRAVRTVFPDLDQFVDTAISREMTPRVKPHPDHLRTALAALAAPPDGTLMVGDHPLDMQVGREVGAFTVGVLTGSGNCDDLTRAGAQCVLASASDLLDLLDQACPP
ncbi:MAG: HAD family hydrolase [Syntrophales bacterium]|nr:HAD family hydrolase [Syntrophales bacterium]MDD4338282.1 HAD family hydrolase [Syntrophales bacterium]HOG08238.1 HAD family hydrolase [Syntrophales bacterium]HPB70272.1 HAD family hydrolase [Syntrophales bacterium]HQN24822.1 HAD family hydrolase [Syntrophales bacterium]